MERDNKLFQLWDVIKNLKYGHNDFKVTIHEDNMIELLESIGFKNISNTKENRKTDLNELKFIMTPGDNITSLGFENNTYIYQPYGSHGSPDFIIFAEATYLMKELKSAKSEKIQWNTHTPQKNWIYIFSSMNLNDTTYFMGQDIVSEEFRIEDKKIQEEINEFRKYIREKYLNLSENTTKMFDYLRPMKVSGENFITNPLRITREYRVNEFINTIYKNGK